MKRDYLLPLGARQNLSAFGERLVAGPAPDSASLERVLANLDDVPAEAVSRASYEITAAMQLGWSRPKPRKLGRLLGLLGLMPPPSPSERELMAADPRYAWLFLFHSNGRIREAALDALVDPPATPFAFAAIALRLNDWAQPVRAAAVRCAERLFPLTSPELTARTAVDLVDKASSWQRWEQERQALDAVFANPAVAARVAPLFLKGTKGPLATRLRQLLRFPTFDGDLAEFARDAVQPSVRATALKCLIDRKASWPVGHGWKWIDKAYGFRQRIVLTDSRELAVDQDPETLIRQGLTDRSAAVRRVAADALMERRAAIRDADQLIACMAADRSPSIRERADYMIRHPLEV
jgi:hypothetical protein